MTPTLPGLLADRDILARLALPDDDPFRLRIDPFFDAQVKTLDGVPPELGGKKCVGFGLTALGYDVRLGHKFRCLRMVPRPGESLRRPGVPSNGLPPVSPFTDQRDVWTDEFEVQPGQGVLIEPGGCLLAETAETVRVPEDVGVLVLCKSTWARCFLNLNTTPLEPGWRGTVTLEIHNQSARTVEVFSGHGVGQLWFFQAQSPPLVPYNRRAAPTYQDQSGPTPAKLGGGGQSDG